MAPWFVSSHRFLPPAKGLRTDKKGPSNSVSVSCQCWIVISLSSFVRDLPSQPPVAPSIRMREIWSRADASAQTHVFTRQLVLRRRRLIFIRHRYVEAYHGLAVWGRGRAVLDLSERSLRSAFS